MAIRKCDINFRDISSENFEFKHDHLNWAKLPRSEELPQIKVYRGDEILESIPIDQLDGYLRTCEHCGFAIGVRKEGDRYHLRGKMRKAILGSINCYASEVKSIVITPSQNYCCSNARFQ